MKEAVFVPNIFKLYLYVLVCFITNVRMIYSLLSTQNIQLFY